MSSIGTKRRSPAGVLVLAAAAVLLTLPAAAIATVPLTSPIRAVFLKEFSKPSYQMNRGSLLVLENDDPFLIHGLGGGLVAAPALPGKIRLVRNSPYLTPGVYPFHDPLHPEMASSLTVTSAGVSPPPDVTAPDGPVRILPVAAGKIAKSGKVRVRVIPDEAVDVDLNLFIGKNKVGSGSGAFFDAVSGVVAVFLPAAARKQVRPGTVLSLRATLTDVTGKATKKRTARRVGAGGKR